MGLGPSSPVKAIVKRELRSKHKPRRQRGLDLLLGLTKRAPEQCVELARTSGALDVVLAHVKSIDPKQKQRAVLLLCQVTNFRDAGSHAKLHAEVLLRTADPRRGGKAEDADTESAARPYVVDMCIDIFRGIDGDELKTACAMLLRNLADHYRLPLRDSLPWLARLLRPGGVNPTTCGACAATLAHIVRFVEPPPRVASEDAKAERDAPEPGKPSDEEGSVLRRVALDCGALEACLELLRATGMDVAARGAAGAAVANLCRFSTQARIVVASSGGLEAAVDLLLTSKASVRWNSTATLAAMSAGPPHEIGPYMTTMKERGGLVALVAVMSSRSSPRAAVEQSTEVLCNAAMTPLMRNFLHTLGVVPRLVDLLLVDGVAEEWIKTYTHVLLALVRLCATTDIRNDIAEGLFGSDKAQLEECMVVEHPVVDLLDSKKWPVRILRLACRLLLLLSFSKAMGKVHGLYRRLSIMMRDGDGDTREASVFIMDSTTQHHEKNQARLARVPGIVPALLRVAGTASPGCMRAACRTVASLSVDTSNRARVFATDATRSLITRLLKFIGGEDKPARVSAAYALSNLLIGEDEAQKEVMELRGYVLLMTVAAGTLDKDQESALASLGSMSHQPGMQVILSEEPAYSWLCSMASHATKKGREAAMLALLNMYDGDVLDPSQRRMAVDRARARQGDQTAAYLGHARRLVRVAKARAAEPPPGPTPDDGARVFSPMAQALLPASKFFPPTGSLRMSPIVGKRRSPTARPATAGSPRPPPLSPTCRGTK